MKIDKSLPLSTSLDTRALPQSQWGEQRILNAAPLTKKNSSAALTTNERFAKKETGFSLQLNQQLSSLQSSEQFLGDISSELSELKLSISRQLSTPLSASERQNTLDALQKIKQLLKERAKRSGEALDSSFTLRLHEPLRTRFTLEGFISMDAIKAAGDETLIFSAGRHFSEPLAIALTQGASTEDILKRFNASLGQENIRAELDEEGSLKFSAPEEKWQKIGPALRVQGEGKLADAGSFTKLNATEDMFLSLPDDINKDSARDLRHLLDVVVVSLDKISQLRDQLSQRQTDVREFLNRQENTEDSEWASHFSLRILDLKNETPTNFPLISQLVTAQSHLSRFSVVSLLS
jgi:hypothetical protein